MANCLNLLIIVGLLITPAAGSVENAQKPVQYTKRFALHPEAESIDVVELVIGANTNVDLAPFRFVSAGTVFQKDAYFEWVTSFDDIKNRSSFRLYSNGMSLQFREEFVTRGDKMYFNHSRFFATMNIQRGKEVNDATDRFFGVKILSHSRGENHRARAVGGSSTIRDTAVQYVRSQFKNETIARFYPILFVRSWRNNLFLEPIQSNRATHPRFMFTIDETEYYGLAGSAKIEVTTFLEIVLIENHLPDSVNRLWLDNVGRFCENLRNLKVKPFTNLKYHDGLEKTVFS